MLLYLIAHEIMILLDISQCTHMYIHVVLCYGCTQADIVSRDACILPYYTNFQATNDGLTSQIKTLQIALAEAKEENLARIEHEAILVHQFQVGVLLIVVYYGNALTATIIYILSY